MAKIEIARQSTSEEILANTEQLLQSGGGNEEVLERIGLTNNTGGTTTAGTVMGKLNALLAKGAVKSIQRGVIIGSSTSISITINTVKPEKCFVVLNNSYIFNQTNSTYLAGLTSSKLTIGANATYYQASGLTYRNVSWQVIEFS